jgi:hypothetical protein
MNPDDRVPNHLVCFNGRECRVEYIQLVGAKWFDVCLFDVETGEIVEFCTRPEPAVPLKTQQALLRREFVELFEAAEIAHFTREVIETERFGDLCKCEFPYGPTHLAWEYSDPPRKPAGRQRSESLAHDEPELDIEH